MKIVLILLGWLSFGHYGKAQISLNPIMDSYIADPNILITDSCFFLFATGKEMPIWKSKDLVHWEQKESIWNDNIFSLKPKNLWAPHFFRYNDKYIGYISIWSGEPETSYTVSVVSNNPDKGYKLASIVLTKGNTGVINPIDSYVYLEKGLVPKVFFGSNYGIYRAELTDDCLKLREGTMFTKVCDEGEGAYVCKIGEWYYLFVSKGLYINDTYRIVYGRSSSIDGIFYDKEGKMMSNGGGSILLKSSKDGIFYGPGHNGEIIEDKDGRLYIVYHAHYKEHKSNGEYRQLMLSELKVDELGWIYVVDELSNKIITPSRCFVTPMFKFR